MRVLLCVTALLAVTAMPTWAASPIGEVDKIKTYAYGTPEGGKREVLYQNDDVFTQEVVETVTDGALHITFADKTILRLGSKSQVTLDRFVYDPNASGGEMVARLGKGVFRFISGKLDKKGVKVLTPTAVIGIRGTDFSVSVAEDGSTSVSVAEGQVEIASVDGGDGASVSVGQIGSVSQGSTGVSVSVGASVSQDAGLSSDAGDSGDNGGGGDGAGDGGGSGGSH